MRHKTITLFALVTAGLFQVACDSVPEPQANVGCHLRVAWDPYEPYSYSDGGELPVGYDIDVVLQVADMMQCSLDFTEMNWSDILVALKNGDVDLTVGTGYKSDRAEWSWYSESYRREVIGLMIRAGTAERFAGDSLHDVFERGLVFGKTTDDTYDSSTDAMFGQFEEQVRPRVSEEENIRRLLNESIDGFLVEVNVGGALAKRLSAAEAIEFHPLAFDAGAYRLQMSKQTVSAERVSRVNAAIQELAHNGWLSEKLQSYSLHGRN